MSSTSSWSEMDDRVVAHARALAADAVQKVEAILEFFFGQLDFLRKGMGVAHQRFHDLAGAGIGRALHRFEHGGRDALFVFDDHSCLPGVYDVR